MRAAEAALTKPLGAESYPPRTAPLSPLAAPSVPRAQTVPGDLQAHLDQIERDILVKALNETSFNRTAAAARLGLSLRQIRYRIARLNISTPFGDEPHDDAS